MSVNEAVAGLEFLYATLSADATLASYAPGGVWRGLAPDATPTPFVVIAFQSAMDTTTMNEFRILSRILYQVKAVGPASQTAQIASAAARIDDLIGKPAVSGTVSGGYIGASYRQSPLFLDQDVNGEVWSDIGGLYRLEIQATS